VNVPKDLKGQRGDDSRTICGSHYNDAGCKNEKDVPQLKKYLDVWDLHWRVVNLLFPTRIGESMTRSEQSHPTVPLFLRLPLSLCHQPQGNTGSQGSSVHSRYHGSCNSLLSQQSPGSMLTYPLAVVWRSFWAFIFIVSSAFPWTFARIANLLGYPIILIPRAEDTTLRIS